LGNTFTCAINFNYRIASTLYTLETCSFKIYIRYIIINTLHKAGGGCGGCGDDDDNNGYKNDD
jgi:hypothetical protein